MIKLYGEEFELKDLPQICKCGDWKCACSFKGKKNTVKRLKKAREKYLEKLDAKKEV